MIDLEKNKKFIDQTSKLATRVDRIRTVKSLFFNYLLKTLKFNIKASQNLRPPIVEKYKSIVNKSYYSTDRIGEIKNLLQSFKAFTQFIEKVQNVNVSEVSKIQSAGSKQIQKSSKYEALMKSLTQHNNDSKTYNKLYSQYQVNCSKLEQMIQKYKQLENPINFYNPNKSTDKTKSIQKKYEMCQNLQNELINYLHLLQSKKKTLGETIKDIRQQYIVFLQEEMKDIIEATCCILDPKKDQLYDDEGNGILDLGSFIKIGVDLPTTRATRARQNNKQALYKDDGLLAQIQNICSNGRNSFTGSKTQIKILQGKCKIYRNKIYQTTEQHINFQKGLLETLKNQMQMIQKYEKDFENLNKQALKIDLNTVNYDQNFFDKFRKYFGYNLFQIASLCLILNQKPIKCLSNIKKILTQKYEKLKLKIQKKQEHLKQFKKKISLLFSQAKSQIKSQFSSSSPQQNNQNVQKNLLNFQNFIKQYFLIEKNIDTQIDLQLRSITSQIKSQNYQFTIANTMDKEYQTIDILNNLNIGSQIVILVKQDKKYDILFEDECLQTKNLQFKSLLAKKYNEKAKYVLKQKNLRDSNPPRIIKRASCCGMSSSRKLKQSTVKAILLKDEQKKVQGDLTINQKGIVFTQNKLNPFAVKQQFVIQVKQIKSYEKFKYKDGTQGFKLNTAMGPISLVPQDSILMQQSLKNQLNLDYSFQDKILMRKSQTNEEKDSKSQKIDIVMDSRLYDKIFTKTDSKAKNDSRSNKSSDFQNSKLPNGILQQKVFYQVPPLVKNQRRKKSDIEILKQLSQSIKRGHYFSQKFKVVNHISLNSAEEYEYQFNHYFYKFLIIERRTCSLNQYQKFLTVQFDWKASFPQYPMLKSFSHSQEVKVQVFQRRVKINIKQKIRKQVYLEFKKKFFEELNQMNNNLSNRIFQVCGREGDLQINQQTQQDTFMKSQISFNQDQKFQIQSLQSNR